MKSFSALVLLIGALCLGMASVAQAQATRTWVSGVGDDVNPCSRTAPCKTFAGAISKTASGGEIDALDPAGYGAVTITKPITIDGGGGQVASILASGVQGVIVNITSGPTGPVILRNLRINGAGSTLGTNGINLISGSPLIVEDTRIFNFSQNGINATASGSLVVRNTSFENTTTGIHTAPSSGQLAVSISESLFSGGQFTFNVGPQTFLSVGHSTITGATNAAVLANGGIINVDTALVANNPGTALNAPAGVIRVSNSQIYNNGARQAGTIASAGNNLDAGNGGSASSATITTF